MKNKLFLTACMFLTLFCSCAIFIDDDDDGKHVYDDDNDTVKITITTIENNPLMP